MDGPYVAGNLDFDPLNLYKSLGDNAAGRKGMRELEVGREGKVKKWKKMDTSWLVVRVAITDLTLTPTLFFFLLILLSLLSLSLSFGVATCVCVSRFCCWRWRWLILILIRIIILPVTHQVQHGRAAMLGLTSWVLLEATFHTPITAIGACFFKVWPIVF
jgi:hypothetical protein